MKLRNTMTNCSILLLLILPFANSHAGNEPTPAQKANAESQIMRYLGALDGQKQYRFYKKRFFNYSRCPEDTKMFIRFDQYTITTCEFLGPDGIYYKERKLSQLGGWNQIILYSQDRSNPSITPTIKSTIEKANGTITVRHYPPNATHFLDYDKIIQLSSSSSYPHFRPPFVSNDSLIWNTINPSEKLRNKEYIRFKKWQGDNGREVVEVYFWYWPLGEETPKTWRVWHFDRYDTSDRFHLIFESNYE